MKPKKLRWPSGTRQRLALALLLYTGQRRSDVVRTGRQHLRGEALEVRQVKTGRRLTIPIHPALAAELAHMPAGQMTFLLTKYGAPFSPTGFYNALREWCDAAGVPRGRSPHGLRKACGRRLAEVYTRAAEQTALARAGLARIGNAASSLLPPRLPTLAQMSKNQRYRRERGAP
ncbi:tyrosine-type recombinase/integrase [Caldovatus aquaticus]|uniref:tyrosine-type recombinase/integrase n=1 Tax=Caldovatus aquaticus TaxID=2865671 RepID=UPI0034E2A800